MRAWVSGALGHVLHIDLQKTARKKLAGSGIELCEAWWYRIRFLKNQGNAVPLRCLVLENTKEILCWVCEITDLETGCSAAWLARHLGVVEVAGSNPVSPT